MGILNQFKWEVETGSTDIGPDRGMLKELINLMDMVEAQVALDWWLHTISERVERLERWGAPGSTIKEERSLRRGWIVNQLRKRLRDV